LVQCELYPAVRAVRYGITPSHYHFFAILEKYNLDTCTFFTPVGEMRFALHEMFEVSGLSMRDLPYEEYIPGTEKLHLLKKDALQVYETYWEVLCHFHICAQTMGLRVGGVKQISWANYLFQDLREKLVSVTLLAASTDTEIEKRISESAISHITESNEDTFRPDTVFDSVHHQAKALISERPYWWGS